MFPILLVAAGVLFKGASMMVRSSADEKHRSALHLVSEAEKEAYILLCRAQKAIDVLIVTRSQLLEHAIAPAIETLRVMQVSMKSKGVSWPQECLELFSSPLISEIERITEGVANLPQHLEKGISAQVYANASRNLTSGRSMDVALASDALALLGAVDLVRALWDTRSTNQTVSQFALDAASIRKRAARFIAIEERAKSLRQATLANGYAVYRQNQVFETVIRISGAEELASRRMTTHTAMFTQSLKTLVQLLKIRVIGEDDEVDRAVF